VVSKGGGLLCATLGWALHTKCLSPAQGRHAIIMSLLGIASLYLIGAAVDYLQCHLQAGGIGSKCNGLWCIQTALMTCGVLVVAFSRPRYLFMACFGVQGMYRLIWASRLDQPMTIRGSVFGMAIVLILLPIVVYFQELYARLTGRCTSLDPKTTERDPEMDLQQPGRALSTLEHIAIMPLPHDNDKANYMAAGAKEDHSRLASSAHIVTTLSTPIPSIKVCSGPCIQERSPALLLRSKEDDSRMYCGSETDSSKVESAKRATKITLVVADRKRKRRQDQNTMIAKLDCLLPQVCVLRNTLY